MSKKSIYVIGLAVVLWLSSLAASAQEAYKGNIRIEPIRLEQRGDSLYVGLNIRLTDVQVGSPLSVELAPWLSADTMKNGLPVVSIKGRQSYKAYERGLKMEELRSSDLPYIVLKGYGNEMTGMITYRHVMAYEPWMADAVLDVAREVMGCGESELLDAARLFGEVKLQPPMPVRIPVEVPATEFYPWLVYVKPEVEAVKTRELQAECRLDFVVNKTDIDPAYRNNPRELDNIKRIIDELKNDPSITVKGLEIIGYASPEGSLAGNKRLSEGRAGALRNYLAAQYDFPLSAYRVTFGGENWDGLLKALDNYPVDNKDEIRSIIENNENEQTRKSRLQAYRGGVPYRELLKNVYPGLRTAICVVDYEIKGFDLVEAVNVFKTRPQNLSLNELYLVANTMENGSSEFADVFETAVRMYPTDEIANLNAAVAALQNRNVATAERYLERVENTALPEYNNAMGALAALRKEFTLAER
ncbi:DUF3868 domain-containing protein, partial [Alistipes sp. OttesenSCG-928-L06]|nr:DUF3868 domain-containing protein [Alistipes sp. OttesenSCG-928-L06]